MLQPYESRLYRFDLLSGSHILANSKTYEMQHSLLIVCPNPKGLSSKRAGQMMGNTEYLLLIIL